MDRQPTIDINTVNAITRMLDEKILQYPPQSEASIALMEFMQELGGEEMPESKQGRLPIPKGPPSLNARTVALMSDAQTVFGFTVLPSPYPATPGVFSYRGDLYVAGPRGGGGDEDPKSDSLLVPGHPEIGDGYVKTAVLIIQPIDVSLL